MIQPTLSPSVTTSRAQQQDEYSFQSQQRTAAAQKEGRFDAEIVPMPSVKLVQNKETGEITKEEVTLTKDEGNRPSTTLEDFAQIETSSRGR